MKRILMGAFVALLLSGTAAADTYVQGYTRSDGTYVKGHYRSDPDGYRYNNYSSQGNTNPYTGERGTQRNEYSNPPAYNKSYPGYGAGSPGGSSGSNCYSAYGCR